MFAEFQLSVKPNLRLLLWPMTADQNRAMNQSELEADISALENGCEQVTIGSHLLAKVAQGLLTNHRAKYSKTKANANYFRDPIANTLPLRMIFFFNE